MSTAAIIQLVVLVACLAISTPLLGTYLAKVYGGGRAPGDRFFGPVERAVYKAVRVDPEKEQRWNVYAISVLAFSLVSVLFLYLLQRGQGGLPLNPDGQVGVSPQVSFNTAGETAAQPSPGVLLNDSAHRLFTTACGACHHDGSGPQLLGRNIALALNTNLHSDAPDNLLQMQAKAGEAGCQQGEADAECTVLTPGACIRYTWRICEPAGYTDKL